jgi:hypothetical protein
VFLDELQAALREADLVVLHGLGGNQSDWVRDALQTRPRVLILPRTSGASLENLPVPVATPGEWYVTPEIPSSPVAGLLAGLPVENLPPLAGVHLPRELPLGSWVALQATRGRRGSPAPIAVAYTEAGRRRVVALAQGYWRWSFRGGEQRTVYARFWGALASWLVQEQTQLAGGAVRPTRRVVPRAEPLGWLASGLAADSIALRLIRDGAVAAESTIPIGPGDSAISAALPPGDYRYEARAFAGGREVGTGSGPLTVEAFSPELTRPARALTDLQSTASTALDGVGRGGQRPLRTSVWPYALILALLATEWILRRRWGLR